MLNKAFTLLELLIVISIISLLSGVTLVQFQGAREKARLAKGWQFSDTLRSSLQTNMIGWWPLDNNANDIYKDQHNGTIHGNPVFIEGIVNRALQFDGNDYVNIGNVNTWNPDHGETTIEAWFNISQYPSSNEAIFSDNWGPEMGLWIKPDGRAYGYTYQSLSTANPVSLNQWHHIVVSFSIPNQRMFFYFDGKKEGERTFSIGNGLRDRPYNIGRDPGGSKYFNGKIDEVRIYSQMVSLSTIRQHYTQGLKKYQNLIVIKK